MDVDEIYELVVDDEEPEEDIELEVDDTEVKPEQVKDIVPAYEPLTVFPDPGMTISQVNVSAIPDPTDIKDIFANGDHDVRRYGTAHVDVQPNLQTPDPITPTEQQQTVTPSAGYDGLAQAVVEPIPAEYIVPSGTLDITENADRINVTNKAAVNVRVPVPSDTTATAADINIGKTAYVQGDKVVGTNDFVKPADGYYLFDTIDILGHMSRLILGIDVVPDYFFTNLRTAFPGQVQIVVFSPTTKKIHAHAFNGASNILIFDFRSCTKVPTLTSEIAFNGTNANAKFVVPDTLYESWRTSAYWGYHSSKIIKGSDYNA